MATSSHPQSFVLPDIVKRCRDQLQFSPLNPHEKEASAASKAWIYSYNLLSSRQLKIQRKTNAGLLTACCLPQLDYERLKTACDFYNLLWMVDDINDDQDSTGVAHTGDIMVKSLFDPSFYHDSELSRACKNLQSRLAMYASPEHLKRIEMCCRETIMGAGKESKLRQKGGVLDLKTYIPIRRLANGVQICFVLTEALLGLAFPSAVYDDPIFSKLYEIANDITWLANDLYSYNIEQARGCQSSNIMTILIHLHGMNLQTAADHIGLQFGRKVDDFVSTKAQLPSWGDEMDADVAASVEALELWVTGMVQFSRNSERYMSEVERATGVVTLRQPENAALT
jgi:hypothetical protein